MYLLDTNVVSDLRKARARRADRHVVAWADGVLPESLFLSAIVVHEIELGIRRLETKNPTQGAMLRSWLDGHVLPSFEGRILPVDVAVAVRSADMLVPEMRPFRDVLIAATALVHGLTVVTRNVRDFAHLHVPIVNPWAQ